MTITEIANAAGVSTATVSRYLNNVPVKEQTKKLLESTILKLNYVPESMVHQIVNTPTTSIAVLTHSLTNNYTMEFTETISKQYNQRGILLYTGHITDTATEYKYLMDLVSRGLKGAILQDLAEAEAQLEIYNKVGKYIPLILVHSFTTNFPFNSITVNQKLGMEKAMNYLLDLGHRDILFVRGSQGFSFDLKEQIWKNRLQEKGIDPTGRCLTVQDADSQTGMKTAYEIVSAYFNEGNRPSAVFACNDIIAMGTLRAIREQGWSVPVDISLMGHDNTVLAECNGITSVDMKIRSVAIASMDLLDYAMNGNDTTPRHISINPELIFRSSVLPLSETNLSKK